MVLFLFTLAFPWWPLLERIISSFMYVCIKKAYYHDIVFNVVGFVCSGGTFTVSNLGTMGIPQFDAILPSGQVCSLFLCGDPCMCICLLG